MFIVVSLFNYLCRVVYFMLNQDYSCLCSIYPCACLFQIHK